jgi:hypothetical protein
VMTPRYIHMPEIDIDQFYRLSYFL